jgi:hypothetical protein
MLPSMGSLPRLISPKIMLSKHPSQSSVDGRPSPGITSLGWFAGRCEMEGGMVEIKIIQKDHKLWDASFKGHHGK